MRFILITGLLTALTLLFACDPNSSPAGMEITPPDGVTFRDTIPVADLPAVIVDYLSTTYPDATITLVETETEEDGTITYEVTLSTGRELEFDANGNLLSDDNDGDDENDNDNDGVTIRDTILVTDLPAVIADYLSTTYPDATITLVETETDEDGTITYEVTLSNGRELEFDANGNLLSDDDDDENDNDENDDDDDDDNDENHIALADLPAGIISYLNDNYPGLTFEEAERDTLCDLVPLITVELEDTTGTTTEIEVELAFSESGALVYTLEKVLTADLPNAVSDALAAGYPDHTPENKVKRLSGADGTVRYLIEVESNQPGGTDLEVLLVADGTIVCDEPEDD